MFQRKPRTLRVDILHSASATWDIPSAGIWQPSSFSSVTPVLPLSDEAVERKRFCNWLRPLLWLYTTISVFYEVSVNKHHVLHNRQDCTCHRARSVCSHVVPYLPILHPHTSMNNNRKHQLPSAIYNYWQPMKCHYINVASHCINSEDWFCITGCDLNSLLHTEIWSQQWVKSHCS